jgi:hypothetical protein
MKVLFLGSVFSEQVLKDFPATNQAANNWSRGFLSSLKDKKNDVECVSFTNNQLWPKGKMIVKSNHTDFDKDFKTYPITYINIPLLRKFSLAISYYFKLKKVLRKKKYDVIFCYNLYYWHYKLFNLIKSKSKKTQLIPIILDEDNPITDNWKSFSEKSNYSDGLVFLSYWGFKNYPFDKPCFHLDSGTSKWLGNNTLNLNKKPVLVYSGKYIEGYGGLSKLADILNSIDFDCEILLTGKAKKRLIHKYFSKNNKVKYLGFLNEESLNDVFNKADIFINYRPPESEDNIMIFPSKINHYLSYGKPVVSSFTAGLSPEYKNYLFYPKNEKVESYLNTIKNIVSFNKLEKKQNYNKIKIWFNKNKTWNVLTDNLFNWIDQKFTLR